MTLTVCKSPLGVTEPSIQAIQVPMLHPSWNKKLSSTLQFNPWCTIFCANIKDYFLNNPMARYEYTKIPLCWFTQDTIDQYNIAELLEKDGFVHAEIRNGMYSLNQAACIAVDRLVKLMKHYGYYPLHSRLMDVIHSDPTLIFGAMKRSKLNTRFVWTILV